MNPSVTCYSHPGKWKSWECCEAFAAGAGGKVVGETPRRLLPGPAAFYGVRPAWRHLWEQAKAEGRRWFYIDNGFIDRRRHYRVAVGRVQAAQVAPDPSRLAALGVEVQPMRGSGRHVVVALQSDEFLAGFGGVYDTAEAVIAAARELAGDLPLVVRRKQDARPLAADLEGARLLVTLSSNAAVEAALAGVPAVALGESVVNDLPGWSVEARTEWAARLAASQWTLDEMRSGRCWRELHGQA